MNWGKLEGDILKLEKTLHVIPLLFETEKTINTINESKQMK